MTPAEFSTWLESHGPSGRTHYEELVSEAYKRVRTTPRAQRDRRGRDLDTGQAEAERIVHQAFAQACGSETFAALAPVKAWPWLLDQVRGHVAHARRGRKRAKKALRAWSGSFRDENGRNVGSHTPKPFSEDDAMTYDSPELIGQRGSGSLLDLRTGDHDDEAGHVFAGPRGAWRGEYTRAYAGLCTETGKEAVPVFNPTKGRPEYAREPHPKSDGTGVCGGQRWGREEIGRDRERSDYSKQRAVGQLTDLWAGARKLPLADPPPAPGDKITSGALDRLAHWLVGCVIASATFKTVARVKPVVGCWNGCRTYIKEIALMTPHTPAP